MIESGVKTEEYREIKEHYIKRLCKVRKDMPSFCIGDCDICKLKGGMLFTRSINIDRVQFSYGYTKRTMTFEVKSIRIGRGKPEWGAPKDREVFIIELGRRVK